MGRLKNRQLWWVIVVVLFVNSVLLFNASAVDTGNISQVRTNSMFGIQNEKKYDIVFRQATLREVLQFMSNIAGVNVIVPEGINGTVNVRFKQITLANALNAIIRANGLEYTIEGGVVRLGNGAQFKETGEDLKTETFRLQYASAEEMLEKLQQLLTARGSAVSDDRTNSIIVRDMLSNMNNIRRFIEDVDVRDAQVLIESKILEATRQFSRDLGIQWGVNSGEDGSKLRVGGVSAIGQSDAGRSLNANLFSGSPTSGLMIGSLLGSTNIDLQILAAEQRGDAYILSDPSIVTSNGKSAHIRSGATLLIQTQSTSEEGASSTGLEEIETGVEMSVTPQITMNRFIKLQIETETSSPDFSREVQGIPIIVDNTASTTVLVRDGETTVIGGLTRYTDSVSNRHVPFLHKIPVLGNLFKSKGKRKENSELMVFIKPTVVRAHSHIPAQMRIREIEKRRAGMRLDPIVDEAKKLKKKRRKYEKVKKRTGHKYVR